MHFHIPVLSNNLHSLIGSYFFITLAEYEGERDQMVGEAFTRDIVDKRSGARHSFQHLVIFLTSHAKQVVLHLTSSCYTDQTSVSIVTGPLDCGMSCIQAIMN